LEPGGVSGAPTLLPGLCSVTFRALAPEVLVREAAKAGVRGIEWGGDVHVPVGDLDRARIVGELCRDNGIDVPSYGSYLRPGAADEGDASSAVLETAAALGARNVRVWAGRTGSADVDDALRRLVAERLHDVASEAERMGLAVSVEYHRQTLTDTAHSAARLLADADHPNLYSYWQPVPELGLPAWLEEIDSLQRWLSHVHVFHWLAGNKRRPLAEGADDWRALLNRCRPAPQFRGPAYAFLEFVLADELRQFEADMAILVGLLEAA
jgi:hypothetical protein